MHIKKKLINFILFVLIALIFLVLLSTAGCISDKPKNKITKISLEARQELKLRKILGEYDIILGELKDAQYLEHADGTLKNSDKVNDDLSDIHSKLLDKITEFREVKDSIYSRGLKKDAVIALEGMEQMSEAVGAKVLGATNFLQGKERGDNVSVKVGLKDLEQSIKLEEKARRMIDRSGF